MDFKTLLTKKKQASQEKHIQLTAALQRAKGALEASKKTLDEMRSNVLPKALASHFLGQLPEKEMARIRRELYDAETFISEFPFLRAGLEEMRDLPVAGMPVYLLEMTIKEYEGLRREIEKTKSPFQIQRLREVARELSQDFGDEVIQETEKFLASLGGSHVQG